MPIRKYAQGEVIARHQEPDPDQPASEEPDQGEDETEGPEPD
jgi:hypothetical protein